MLYIEDFLELIEPFPQELRERLTEMREIDLKIQNETDKLDEKIDSFFQQCKKQKADWKIENSEEIRKEYLKLIENADDKVLISNQLYDLLEKYIKKLDQELQKFKLELEADHAGITSKLEQELSSKTLNEHVSLNKINSYSSLNLTFNNLNNQTNDDSDFTLCPSSSSDLMQMMLNSQNNFSLSENLNSTSNHKRKHSNFSEKSTNLISGNLFGRDDEDSSSSWNSSSLNLNNSILNINRKSSVNASSINKRTLSSSSRQTSNLDANLMNMINSSISLNNSSQKKPSLTGINIKNKKTKLDKNRIKKSRLTDLDYDDEAFDDDENARNDFYQTDEETNDETIEAPSEVTSSENGVNTIGNEDDDDLETDEDDQTSEDSEHKFKIPHKNSRNQYTNNHRQFKEEWNSGEDTNERYCICKDISYGDMIMCDNGLCETQWFHFVCVGLNSAPKGKWYCPKCVSDIKKKRKEKSLIISTSSNNTNLNMSINSMLNTTITASTSSTLTPGLSTNPNEFTSSNP